MIIKIISLNIWLGGYFQDAAISFLKEHDADIILLQEAFNGKSISLDARHRTVQVLKEQLSLPYEGFVPNFDQQEESAQIGNAIISRFPIMSSNAYGSKVASTSEHSYSYNLQHVILETLEGKVDILNLHGVWDLDGDNFSPLRRDMSDRIIGLTANKRYVILAGDTNAKPTNRAIIAIGEHLKSVFGNKLTTTFNMRHKDNPGYASAAVDMIFVSGTIQVVESSCPEVDISDHLPLVATLKI